MPCKRKSSRGGQREKFQSANGGTSTGEKRRNCGDKIGAVASDQENT